MTVEKMIAASAHPAISLIVEVLRRLRLRRRAKVWGCRNKIIPLFAGAEMEQSQNSLRPRIIFALKVMRNGTQRDTEARALRCNWGTGSDREAQLTVIEALVHSLESAGQVQSKRCRASVCHLCGRIMIHSGGRSFQLRRLLRLLTFGEYQPGTANRPGNLAA